MMLRSEKSKLTTSDPGDKENILPLAVWQVSGLSIKNIFC